MINIKASFNPESKLEHALELLRKTTFTNSDLPNSCPNIGIGEMDTLNLLAPHVLGNASHLNDSTALAHMYPPTPWITWAVALWNARLNQNLLHPATSPFATEA